MAMAPVVAAALDAAEAPRAGAALPDAGAAALLPLPPVFDGGGEAPGGGVGAAAPVCDPRRRSTRLPVACRDCRSRCERRCTVWLCPGCQRAACSKCHTRRRRAAGGYYACTERTAAERLDDAARLAAPVHAPAAGPALPAVAAPPAALEDAAPLDPHLALVEAAVDVAARMESLIAAGPTLGTVDLGRLPRHLVTRMAGVCTAALGNFAAAYWQRGPGSEVHARQASLWLYLLPTLMAHPTPRDSGEDDDAAPGASGARPGRAFGSDVRHRIKLAELGRVAALLDIYAVSVQAWADHKARQRLATGARPPTSASQARFQRAVDVLRRNGAARALPVLRGAAQRATR